MLLEKRPYDDSITLVEGKTSPKGPLYSLSAAELAVLMAYIEKMIDKGFIRVSSSPAASPLLFATKPGGGLRFCVDYRTNLCSNRQESLPTHYVSDQGDPRARLQSHDILLLSTALRNQAGGKEIGKPRF